MATGYFATMLQSKMDDRKNRNYKLKAKRHKMREIKKKIEEEKDDPWSKLGAELRNATKSMQESRSQKDTWRKVEEGPLITGHKACNVMKRFVRQTTCMDSAQAIKTTALYQDLCMFIQTLNEVFLEVQGDFFEDEESTKRYYEVTYVDMLDMWTNSCELSTDMVILLHKYWEVSNAHTELGTTLSETCSSGVKLLSVAVDLTKRPCAEEGKETLLGKLTDYAINANETFTKLLKYINESLPGGPADAILQTAIWSMYGLKHVNEFGIRPLMVEGTKDQECMQKYATSLEAMLEAFSCVEDDLTLGYDADSPEPRPKKTQETNEESKEDKENEEKQESNSKDYEEIMKKLEDVYMKFSDEIFSNGKMSVALVDPADSDNRILYKPEIHKELAHCGIGSCEMKDRAQWLSEIEFASDQTLVSDIYVITNGPMTVTKEVQIDFRINITTPCVNKNILLKIKSGGKWQQLAELKQDASKTEIHLSFKTTDIEAFIAYVENPRNAQEVTPEGALVTSPTNSQTFVHFPEESVMSPTTVYVDFITYDKIGMSSFLDKCPDQILAVQDVSQVIELSSDATVDPHRNLTFQFALDGDDSTDGRDTQVVAVRYKDDQVHVLGKQQCHIKQVDYGVYTLENKGLWGVGLARIKKVFLNMKETVKKEFMMMFGKVQLCNVVTLVDDALRVREKGFITFWIEVLEKCDIKEHLELRKKEGLVEVRGSRSKDIPIKQTETLTIHVDGQIKLIGNNPTDTFSVTYLMGTDNHIAIPLESKRDNEKLPYVVITCKEDGSSYVQHTVAIAVRELTETPTDEMMSKQITKEDENNTLRDIIRAKEEAANNILAHNSLMCLARVMTASESEKLAIQLGVSKDKVVKFQETFEGDTVGINFRILCEWRGKSVRAAMVDFLVSALQTISHSDYAVIIVNARNAGRGLTVEDFQLL